MEWTGDQLRQLCTDNNVKFIAATAKYISLNPDEEVLESYVYRRSTGLESFTLHFLDAGFSICAEGKHYSKLGHDYSLGPPPSHMFAIRLGTYQAASQAVTEDTYDCWNAAFRAALASPRYKRYKEYGSVSKVIDAFKKFLVDELATIGKVKEKSGTFIVSGIGAIEFWSSSGSLYIGPHNGDKVGRGWGGSQDQHT